MYFAANTIFTLSDVNRTVSIGPNNPKMVRDFLFSAIGFNLVDTLICWIFLGIVARSPRSVGCFTVFKNLICLPRFWTLVFLLVLYILGAALKLQHFFSSASQNQDATMKVAVVLEIATDLLNVFTKVALVGVLNYVQVRNVALSLKYWLLKGTLVVIWISQMCTLISTMVTVYHIVRLLTATGNSDVQREAGSFAKPVMELFFLPFVTRTTE